MKKSIKSIVMLSSLKAVIISMVVMATFYSCKKHGMTNDMTHDVSHAMLNINYPAAYIVNGSSNNISVVKLSDNTVTETISLNGATFPHHIYMNPAKT